MRCGLTVFLIADKRDVEVFGCRRWELLNEVLEVLKDRLADYDREADVEKEGLISHADALREIFAGNLFREQDCGWIYGWAYELYYSSMGDWLSNSHFCPCYGEWFLTLDKFLDEQAVPLRFQKLVFQDFPIPIAPDDSPCGGLWEHEEIVAAQLPLERAIEAATDEEVAEALAEVASWLRQAAAIPGSVIVGFFR
jgi:hypothetical protein